MAFLLKRAYEGYFWAMNDLADPRASDYLFMSSPIPILVILYVWHRFIYKWGPDYMKDRKAFELKKIMIIYNLAQVITNGYIVYYAVGARHLINWRCMEMDYSESYWGRKFLSLGHLYFILKIVDLLDTVFFVLRKKTNQISFLHTYHHFLMVITCWIGAKFLGGGHSYFLGLTNGIIHALLYSYYLLTSYDNRYGKLIWMKKFITQAQLLQFMFLIFIYGQLFFRFDCSYPKIMPFLFVPQNFFMVILFGDFYVRTYILAPRKKKLAEQAAAKND